MSIPCVKVAVMGDVHLADKPPSVRTESYGADILAKVEYVVQRAKEEQADVILQLGDLFHIKSPSRTSHSMVQDAHDALTGADIPVLIVPGNHDMMNDRIDSLDKQPLGALSRMRGVNLLIGAHPDPSIPLFGIPYLQDWAELPEWFTQVSQWAKKRAKQHTLVGMHAPIFPSGKTPPYDFIDSADLAQMMPKRCTAAYGHIHDPEGHWTPGTDSSQQVANYGALSRGSLHAETLKRQPRAYMWRSDTGEISPFDIPVRPVEEVFNLSEKQVEQSHQERMTQFLESVGTEKISAPSIETLLESLDSQCEGDETGEVAGIVRELIEWSQADDD